MLSTCRDYYRDNQTELKNIDEFDRTYKSIDAISWYMKETLIHKYKMKISFFY